MFLLDTNIFLEILLGQDKSDACKNFMTDNQNDLLASDYTIHSIGIILFKLAREDDFKTFLDDIRPTITFGTIPISDLEQVIDAAKSYGLDFDDAYQVAVVKTNGAKIVTMDKHFSKVIDDVEVIFI